MITLHYLENSRAQRILWLLEELGIEYEVKHYYRDKVTQLAPAALKKVHPLGKSPVITDGEVCVSESAAIVEYLIDKYGKGKLIPSDDEQAMLKYREFMHYAEGTIMPFLVFTLIFNKIKEAPMPFFVKPIAKMIANKTLQGFVTPNVTSNLDYLEKQVAATGWFAGDTITGADFMMSFPLEAAAMRINLKIDYPNLAQYLDSIHTMPSYQRAVEKGLPYAYG